MNTTPLEGYIYSCLLVNGIFVVVEINAAIREQRPPQMKGWLKLMAVLDVIYLGYFFL